MSRVSECQQDAIPTPLEDETGFTSDADHLDTSLKRHQNQTANLVPGGVSEDIADSNSLVDLDYYLFFNVCIYCANCMVILQLHVPHCCKLL